MVIVPLILRCGFMQRLNFCVGLSFGICSSTPVFHTNAVANMIDRAFTITFTVAVGNFDNRRAIHFCNTTVASCAVNAVRCVDT